MSHALRAAVEAGVVLVYLLAIGTMLYGSAVPTYQAAANERIADSVLSDSVRAITAVVSTRPESATERLTERKQQDVQLPDTIDGRPYRLVGDGKTLRLKHPDPAISRAVVLPFERSVSRIEGGWTSTEPATLELRAADGDGYVVHLVTAREDDTHDGDRS